MNKAEKESEENNDSNLELNLGLLTSATSDLITEL